MLYSFHLSCFADIVFCPFGVWISFSRSFVNNVWYIKILSPEDIQKMGEQAVESLGPSSGQRLNSTGADSHEIVSGLPSIGSLEY